MIPMPKKCQFRGCEKDAVYEIEFMTNPPHGILVYVCDEHFPDGDGLIDPIDKVKQIVGPHQHTD